MDPESLKNTQPYLVLVYRIEWPEVDLRSNPRDYYLLDFRAYQRPEQLTEEQISRVAVGLLSEKFDRIPVSFKIKVIES